MSQTTPVSAPPGTTTTVNFAFSINADCSSDGLPTVRIDKQPANGIARAVPRDGFTRMSQAGLPALCSDKKISGVAVEYTPNKNYLGPDFLEFETVTKTGTTIFRAPVTVEKPQQTDDQP